MALRGLTMAKETKHENLRNDILTCIGDVLREVSAFTCVTWQGLGQAGRVLRKRNIIDGAQVKKAHFARRCLQFLEAHHRFFESIPHEHQLHHQDVC